VSEGPQVSESRAAVNIHATGVLVGGRGVLIRGSSGAGKSLLALELLARHAEARLVADDRVDLAPDSGGLLMRAPPALAGRIELRGRGIVARPFVSPAPVHLVIDLIDDLVRMLEETALTTDLLDMTLPRCPVPRRGVADPAHQLLLVEEALSALGCS
jgi:serine kinase of HPr protein (carbohydrate metabolism regulator)